MAGINSITKRIISDAEDQAREIEKEAYAKVEEILRAANEDVRNRKFVAREDAEVEGRRSAERIIAAARLNAGKDVLKAKRAILDRCFVEAKNNLVKLSKNDKDNLIDALVKSVPGSDAMEKVMLPEGGILFKDGDITYNYSFDSLIKTARAKCEREVLKVLGW